MLHNWGQVRLPLPSMTTFTRRTALTGTLGALAVTAACSTTTAAPGAPAPSTPGLPSGSITVYNAQHESLTKEWIDGFSKATGVKVQYRQGSDTEMANQIATEGSASPADVFLTENSPGMTIVERKGLFATVDQATQAQVPQAYRPSTNAWVGIAARSTVFVYDKRVLGNGSLPASLMDLAQPQCHAGRNHDQGQQHGVAQEFQHPGPPRHLGDHVRTGRAGRRDDEGHRHQAQHEHGQRRGPGPDRPSGAPAPPSGRRWGQCSDGRVSAEESRDRGPARESGGGAGRGILGAARSPGGPSGGGHRPDAGPCHGRGITAGRPAASGRRPQDRSVRQDRSAGRRGR